MNIHPTPPSPPKGVVIIPPSSNPWFSRCKSPILPSLCFPTPYTHLNDAIKMLKERTKIRRKKKPQVRPIFPSSCNAIINWLQVWPEMKPFNILFIQISILMLVTSLVNRENYFFFFLKPPKNGERIGHNLVTWRKFETHFSGSERFDLEDVTLKMLVES